MVIIWCPAAPCAYTIFVYSVFNIMSRILMILYKVSIYYHKNINLSIMKHLWNICLSIYLSIYAGASFIYICTSCKYIICPSAWVPRWNWWIDKGHTYFLSFLLNLNLYTYIYIYIYKIKIMLILLLMSLVFVHAVCH